MEDCSNKDAFQKGWFQVRRCDESKVRNRIMVATGALSRTAFLRRMNGIAYGSPAEREAIEKIFNDFGITDVWGLVD